MKTASNWIGKMLVRPVPGAESLAKSCSGAYGLIACLSGEIVDALSQIRQELAENDLKLDGAEWFLREEDLDRELSEEERALIGKLTSYPVQFHTFHWFP